MIMQLLWLIIIYFLAGLTGNPLKRKLPSQKRDRYSGLTKSVLVSILIGIGGVLTSDWLSDGNPLWPTLGLISSVIGALFPFSGQSERSLKTGLAVYFGGVFYLKPVVALTGFGIAFEGLLLSKDQILMAIIFSSILPIFFNFSQINPFFFWATVVIQLVFLIKLKNEVLSRIREFFIRDKGNER